MDGAESDMRLGGGGDGAAETGRDGPGSAGEGNDV